MAADHEQHPLGKLTAKQRRVISYALRLLFSRGALDPIETPLAHGGMEFFRRRLVIDRQHEVLLSNQGVAALDQIVALLSESDAFADDVVYNDIWQACRTVVAKSIAKLSAPENASELLELVREEIAQKIGDHTFVAALDGVGLVGADRLPLGNIELQKSIRYTVERAELKDLDSEIADQLWRDGFGKLPCFVGTFHGTFDAAQKKFSDLALLVVGLIAVVAGAMHERGMTSFSLVPLINLPLSSARTVLIHWEATHQKLGFTVSFGRGQLLKLQREVTKELTEPGPFQFALSAIQRTRKTDLEEGLALAIYWYGDAQRDPTLVMQFVKYWSCIECFFSIAADDISEAVASGLTVTLTFGHYQYWQQSEYRKRRAAIKTLYSKRSRALHGARHSHVSARNVVDISQWAAWLVQNIASFAHAKLPSRQALLEVVKELDAKERGRAGQGA